MYWWISKAYWWLSQREIIKKYIAERAAQKFNGIENNEKPHVIGIYRLIMKAGSVVIYELTLNTDRFADCEVIRDFDVFVQRSSLILANRMTPELRCVQDKVYTRDIFAVD